MRTIGLTGGIGSGKSTVAQMLVARGAAFENADLVGHRSYLKGTPTYERLVDAFGEGVVGADGEIDRQKLARRIFAEPDQRRRLNDIVWPAMAQMMARDLDEFRAQGQRVAVLEAAILLEAGWQWLVDEVWVVVSTAETAVKRLEEKGMDREQAEARIRSQLSNEERIFQADVVIENDGTLAELEQKVQTFWDQLRKRVANPAVG
jgi:dephospho-CoA kinase